MGLPSSAGVGGPALPNLALAQTLNGLAEVVGSLADAHYAAAPTQLPGATSSIGVHVRHCLNHVQSLLSGRAAGVIDYDRRERGSIIETDRQAALELLRQCMAALGDLEPAELLAAVEVDTVTISDRPPVRVSSSVGREVAFVLSHTIHHHAVIGMLAAHFGYTVPADFVYAPATLAWMSRSSCAPSP